jgi:hypothetical protein
VPAGAGAGEPMVRWRSSIISCLAACAVLAQAGPALDPRVQTRVHEYVARAERCVEEGRVNEARAVSEMLLLRRDLRFALDLGGLEPHRAQEAREAFLGAADAWHEALGGAVRFVEAPWTAADVKVSFVQSVRMGGCDVAGYAVWRRQLLNWRAEEFTYQVSADIQIRTVLPGGTRMRPAAMRHTCLHELGHVLGLNDSPRGGEAMSALSLASPVARPSDAEARSLLAVMERAGLLLSQATAQSLALAAPGSA